MRLGLCAVMGVLLGAGLCLAKGGDAPAGQFQLGATLQPLATIPMKSAEISAYMPEKKKLFVVGGDNLLEIVDLSDVAKPRVVRTVSLGGDASSVTVNGNLFAVSLLNAPEWKKGHVQVMRYTDSLEVLGFFEVCHQPDMLTFTPDGSALLVACEGSPDMNFHEDPEGGVAIVTAPKSGPWSRLEIAVAGFDGLDTASLMAQGVRRTGAQEFVKSLEPEYITVSPDSKTAWVSLQENNAIAVVDIAAKKITNVYPLGFVDHSVPGFGLDAKKNSKVEIANYPLRGLRQPDGISSFVVNGRPFVVTANEGAPVNDYKAWTDVTSLVMLSQQGRLDPKVFTPELVRDLGGISVSNLERCDAVPDMVPGGRCPYAYTFGSRSVSIFDGATGALVWDSGDMLERMIAKVAPDYFNWNAKKNKVKMDSRSEDKGCEPENVTVGEVAGKRYAFVGLERTSGIAVFDITDFGKTSNPSPRLVDYYLDPSDRGPEGVLFIPAEKSPNGTALLVVGYEYSKTLTIYTVK